jgi:hypothetical protein
MFKSPIFAMICYPTVNESSVAVSVYPLKGINEANGLGKHHMLGC